jgi:hypothetical protein
MRAAGAPAAGLCVEDTHPALARRCGRRGGGRSTRRRSGCKVKGPREWTLS